METELKKLDVSAVMPKPAELIKERFFARRKFSGDVIYHFCPICAERVMRGQDRFFKTIDFETIKRELDPMEVQTWKCLYQHDPVHGIVEYEDRNYCSTCRKNIKVEDFLSVYSKPMSFEKHSKLIDLSDYKALEGF